MESNYKHINLFHTKRSVKNVASPEQSGNGMNYTLFFGVLLLTIIAAAYLAMTDTPHYYASNYITPAIQAYDCIDCSKIVTLQDVWIDENGVVRHLT